MSTGRLGAGDTAIQPTILDAKGDLIVATAADTPARLAVGTNGQVLKADSSTATGLAWGADASGKVLQVVNATTTSSTLISSTSYTDSSITASITPSATSSKILVLATININAQRSNPYSAADVRIVRGATAIASWNGTGDSRFVGVAWPAGTTYTQHWHTTTIAWLDSPSTTSSTTYKIQGRVNETTDSPSITFQFSSSPSSITLLEIGA